MLDDMPKLPKGVVTVGEMDERVRERDATIAVLSREMEVMKAQNASQASVAQQQLRTLEDKLQARDTRLGELSGRIDELEGERDEAKAKHSESENERQSERQRQNLSEPVNRKMEALATKLKAEQEAVTALEAAIRELQHKLIEATEHNADLRPASEHEELTKKFIDERRTLKRRIEALEKQLARSERVGGF